MQKIKKIALFSFVLILCQSFVIAQSSTIDSLKSLLRSNVQDTNRVKNLILLCYNNVSVNTDTSLYYGEMGLALAKKIKYVKGEADAYLNLGLCNTKKGQYDTSLVLINKAMELYNKIKYRRGLYKCNMNMGSVYKRRSMYAEAVVYYINALKLCEEMKDSSGIGGCYNSIGLVYSYQQNYSVSKEYYEKGLKMAKAIGDKSLFAELTMNIAGDYFEQQQFDKAIQYYQITIPIFRDLNDKTAVAQVASNIAQIYAQEKNYTKALENSFMALKEFEMIGDKEAIGLQYSAIATIYQLKKDYKNAIDYHDRSISVFNEIHDLNSLKTTYSNLAALNAEIKDFEKAYSYQKLYIKMNDSILNIESSKQIAEISTKYESEKKETENRLLQTENLLSNETIKEQRTVTYFIIGGLIIVSVLAFFIFKGLKKQRRANSIISRQKHIVEEKHKEITDSINYAERIQRSFLATKELLDENLKEYFVLFKPKDVVSGDFYWASKLNNNRFALATADSTGHGVPGAIMSLLNITSIEGAIKDGHIQAADILDSTRRTIIDRLKKDGSPEGGKDGMDCSLCLYDFENKKLSTAAAHNPVWIVRGGFGSAQPPFEVIEIKADKMPVGKHDRQDVSFTQHEIDLQAGDVVYTLTDGFPDQFGGEKGKKFMSKNLRELLVTIAHLPMSEQKDLLEKTFAEWVVNMEQVDDVTLIGIRI